MGHRSLGEVVPLLVGVVPTHEVAAPPSARCRPDNKDQLSDKEGKKQANEDKKRNKKLTHERDNYIFYLGIRMIYSTYDTYVEYPTE